MHKKDTHVTRMYEDNYRCLTCTGRPKHHNILEKRKDLFLSITDQHLPALVSPQDGNCFVPVRMANYTLMYLAAHTVWQIVNDWSKNPRKWAVSADQHGLLSLLQIALYKRKKVTLFFSSGSGLTSEGAQGQTYALQRILQLCNAKEFKKEDNSLIRHIIFPHPLITKVARPQAPPQKDHGGQHPQV